MLSAVLLPLPAASAYQTPEFRDAAFHSEAALSGDRVQLDVSSLSQGYVAVSATSTQKLKFQVLKDDLTYTYDLKSDGTPGIFPVQSGDGNYRFRVMENVVDTKYSELYSFTCDVWLQDEFQPFLRPSTYVNYTQDSACARKAAEFAAGAADELELVKAIYDYVCSTVTYDRDKASSVKSGYLPDPTVQYYFNEQGLRPSRKMLEQLERLGKSMQHQHEALDVIQAELTGQNDTFPGGYVCSYPIFVGIYRMVERMLERGGQSVYLMLCTVIDGKGNPLREGPTLDELTKRMGDSVRRSIRRGDAMCQYGKGQYLALLVNTTRENCGVVQKRINERFIIGRQRTKIQYYVNSVFWTPPIELTDASMRDDS